jgi:endonuclease I
MIRSWRIVAALLLAAAPLNAQTRVAAPSLIPSVSISASASAAAPLFSAPSLGASLLSAPALLAAPAPSLVTAAPAPSFAAAVPAAVPEAAFSASPAAVPISAPSLSAGAAPIVSAAADGIKRSLPGNPDAASAPNVEFGGKLFDGASELRTRSGSVFSPSRQAQPALNGRPGFVRVKGSPAAPVKAVPDTQGLSGAALLDRVSQIAAKGQTQHGYHEASAYLFSTADNHTLNGVRGVADAYSGVFIPGKSADGHDYSETGDPTHDGWSRRQVMNVEHTFPQSLFKQNLPMRSDLHHLMATFEHPNGMRGSLPFGAVKDSPDYRNDAGAKRDAHVFEPPDFTKGRVARNMLYFYTRYKDMPFFDSHVAAFWNPQIATFLDWNRRFPPTVEEQTRNDQVQAFQGNRNPFVDDPGLADRIGADAFRAGSGAPTRAQIREFAAPQEFVRRSDKPRKGKKRSSFHRKHSSRFSRR